MPVLVKGNQKIPQETLDRLESIWQNGQNQRQARIDARRKPALIRLWDGDWNLKGRLVDAIRAKFQWKLNDTGVGVVTLPIDHWLAEWALNFWGRPKKNIHITMDNSLGQSSCTHLFKDF